MRKLLLDTGPLVALLDKSEKNHQKSVEFLKTFSGQLVSTEPVLTEALYLLNQSISFQKTCIQFIIEGGIQLVPSSYDTLKRAIFLMEAYHDTPMDFADATLVVLAEDSGIHDIWTLDYRGFNTYRIHHKKSFVICP